MYPNAPITVIARPRKGSWQSVLPFPCASLEEKDGGYGLPQPVTSVTGFAMTKYYCLVLSLYAGARRGVAMLRVHCLVLCLLSVLRRSSLRQQACMIANSMYPNAATTVIARPRKGSWQSVLPSPCASLEEKDGVTIFTTPGQTGLHNRQFYVPKRTNNCHCETP